MQIFKYHMSMLRKRFESIGKIVHVVDLDYSKNDKNFFLSDVCLGHLPEESLLALILTGYKLELADIPFLDEVQNEDMIDHFTKDIQSNLLSSVTSNEFCLAASFVQERMIVLGSHVLRYLGSKCSETIIVILKETIS